MVVTTSYICVPSVGIQSTLNWCISASHLFLAKNNSILMHFYSHILSKECNK